MLSIHVIRLTLLAAAVLAASTAFAQVKTDGQWRGAGGAALSMTSGNSSTSALALNGDMARATIEDKITLGANTNYGRSKNAAGISSTTANKWSAAGEYDYNLSPAVFVFGKLGLEGDGVIDLSLRTTLAAGLGYKLIDTKELSFNVFGGVGYSTDKYSATQNIGGVKGTSFSRSSLFLGEESQHQLSASTTFKQRLELYPGLSGDKAKIIKFTAGLGVAMSSTLNLSVGLTDNYNSLPAAGNKKNDLGLFTGINVKFGAP